MDLRVDLIEESNPVRIQVEEIQVFAKTSEQVRKRLKKEFIQNEIEAMSEFFGTIEKNPLTTKQREAVIINEDNNLVIAGAGSGKTSTIAAEPRT